MSENGRRLGEEKEGTLVQLLGFETIDDVYCRKFVITQTLEFSNTTQSGGSGQSRLQIHVWEDYGARRLHRIEMHDCAWVVEELVTITQEEDNPLPEDAFDIDALLQSCERSRGLIPSKFIDPDELTDVLIPDQRLPRFHPFTLLQPC